MKIQGINCAFKRDEWIQNLNTAFCSGSSTHKGHAYLYITKCGQSNTFFPPAPAQPSQCKLNIDDIICITYEFFKNETPWKSTDLVTLRDALNLMDKGAQKSLWSRIIHWLRGLGFNTTHQLIEEQMFFITSERIKAKYDKLKYMLEDYRTIVQQLGDERFDKDFGACSLFTENWIKIYETPHPRTSADWKEHERSLALLFLKIKQMLNFSEQALITQQQLDKLEKLLKLHPDSPISMTELNDTISAYKLLVDNMFDPLTTHDEEEYKKSFKIWDDHLQQWIDETILDYSKLSSSQNDLIQEILQPAPKKLKRRWESKVFENGIDSTPIVVKTIKKDDEIYDDPNLANALDFSFTDKPLNLKN